MKDRFIKKCPVWEPVCCRVAIRSFDEIGETADFKVTEVWKLINGGKSISIQVNSSSISGDHTMKLVYDKTN